MYHLNRLVIIVLFFVFMGLPRVSCAQLILSSDFVVVSGVVKDADKDSVLVFANVYNMRTMRGTVTNENGWFRYFAVPGDTLWISSMGYYPLHIAIEEGQEEIRDTFYLKARAYKIPDVEILALTRYEKLRYDVKNMKIPRDVQNARDNFPVVNHELMSFYERGNENFGLVVSPISALYYAFSKEGKEIRKLAELQKQDAISKQIEPHFNEEMVHEITGLEGEELQKFMEFCNFSEEFLINSADYYIIELILEQYEDFCVLKSEELKEK